MELWLLFLVTVHLWHKQYSITCTFIKSKPDCSVSTMYFKKIRIFKKQATSKHRFDNVIVSKHLPALPSVFQVLSQDAHGRFEVKDANK